MNDFVLKFLAVLAKVSVTLLPASILPYQKRGKHYLFLEVTSQLHRQLVPLQPWLMYLLAASDEQGPASIPNKVCEASCNISFYTVLLCTLRNCKGLKDKCSCVGTRSLPDCSVYGCERENLLASPQALESGFLQTAPVNEVILTCSLSH